MSKRLELIRNTIESVGGRTDFRHFVDTSRGDSVYKVEKYSDGMTPEQRQEVVDKLNLVEGVQKAYLSCKQVATFTAYDGERSNHIQAEGGHIKVKFYGKTVRDTI